jgi:sec-independent protein translocase protein TatA
VLLIVLIFFGTKRLSSIGSDLGGAVKGFRKSMTDAEKEEEQNQLDNADAEFSESTSDAESDSKQKV